eukprot:NODE_27_length_39007_cov_1.590650.p17 type:complete len:265 gc:universal NODE_27_length_39007_cov_1.590650:15302-16096(+)
MRNTIVFFILCPNLKRFMSDIIQWHLDGWYKGIFCALSLLSLFLSIPSFFEQSALSKINGILVLLTLFAMISRPTRMVYSADACGEISVLYWALTSVYVGFAFVYYGARTENYKCLVFAAGASITIFHLVAILGYNYDCPDGMLIDEYFSPWTFFSGVSLILFGSAVLVITHRSLRGLIDLEDSRLTRINMLSKFSLFFSEFSLVLAGIFSFTIYSNIRLFFMFLSVYLITTSHLGLLLQKSLQQDTKPSANVESLSVGNVHNK